MSLLIAEYQTQRASLIGNDRSLRRENLTAGLRSDKEFEADRIIRKIRALEAETIWKEEHPSIPHPFPGMEFLTGRSIIVKTQLFEILSKMPKGALLHAHLDATVNAEFLLQLALKYPAMHVRIQQPLSPTNLSTNLPEFKCLPQDQFTDQGSLTDALYTLGSWVSLHDARESFAPELGGKEGFDRWVIGSMTINPSEAYGTHNTITKIWQKFASTFVTSTGLIRVAPIWEEYIREFFLTSIADGISYIEVRINFLYKFMYGADGRENVTHREWLVAVEKVMTEVKAELAQQGRAGEFVGVKVIYSTIRFITPEELKWYLEDCIALKKEFPHLIAGFDLVGDENVYKPLIYYAEALLRFRERVEKEGLDIPFIFHAGETLGDGTEADENLYDAILLGTKRIGHGEKGIARLTSSMPMHPLPAVLNNGVPVVLCSDDPSVFGNMGLTFDYYQVLAASEITGLSTLGALARDSLEFSTLNGDDKRAALTEFERRWNEFIEYVVVEYGK
ncbi:hypothetical protein CPB84DRAFT_1812196 [Gymnopilus junonius]|uniref:Adenosine deaminase domain-containing protein n=1 Tax=Gymnopilus junonius TaxID=109634 RepID=A0A9P5P138_GYMJU|nr:hypothetical protein CPB84DRAFT_1812196 [Gymnopilus junonius]